MIGNSEIIKSKNKFANKKDLMLIAGDRKSTRRTPVT